MPSNEESLSKKINDLHNLMEEITGKETDIQINNGDLLVIITNKNKQALYIPYPDDVKLPELDELFELTSNLPEDVRK